jgi:hypothetical protein
MHFISALLIGLLWLLGLHHSPATANENPDTPRIHSSRITDSSSHIVGTSRDAGTDLKLEPHSCAATPKSTFSARSIFIEPKSLTTSSRTPVIMGYACNWDENATTILIRVTTPNGTLTYESGLYGVGDGSWSIPIIPSLLPGNYTAALYDNHQDRLATSTLTVSE